MPVPPARGTFVRRIVFSAMSLIAMASQGVQAGLVINLIDGGGTEPANLAGGGNLMTIAAEAASVWQRAFAIAPGKWEVNLTLSWDTLGSGGGQFDQTTQGGDPNRITSGRIRLNNSGKVPFFADPTPWEDSEYGLLTNYGEDYGTGLVNIGREFTDPKGDAIGRIDLLTVVLHEIGHGLGLNKDYSEYARQMKPGFFIPIQPPLPLAGFDLQLSISDHLFDGIYPHALMIVNESPNLRKRVSAADILVNAQLSGGLNPNLNPYAVPEPAAWVSMTIALGAISLRRFRGSRVRSHAFEMRGHATRSPSVRSNRFIESSESDI